jgi:phage-related minor tail protein
MIFLAGKREIEKQQQSRKKEANKTISMFVSFYENFSS